MPTGHSNGSNYLIEVILVLLSWQSTNSTISNVHTLPHHYSRWKGLSYVPSLLPNFRLKVRLTGFKTDLLHIHDLTVGLTILNCVYHKRQLWMLKCVFGKSYRANNICSTCITKEKCKHAFWMLFGGIWRTFPFVKVSKESPL